MWAAAKNLSTLRLSVYSTDKVFTVDETVKPIVYDDFKPQAPTDFDKSVHYGQKSGKWMILYNIVEMSGKLFFFSLNLSPIRK